MIRFNLLGVIFFLGSSLFGFGARALSQGGVVVSVFTAGALLMLSDMGYRALRGTGAGRNRWWSAHSGGHITVVPAWRVGGVLIVIGFFMVTGRITP